MNAYAPTKDHKIIAAAALVIVSEIDLSRAISTPSQAPVVLPDQSAEVVQRDLLLPWQRRKIMQFIEANLTETIKVEELATMTKLSKTYFSRVFKAAYKESPYSYVLRRRMELAKELIAETNAALSEIALDCGMADQAHLCKTFRKVFGTTPNNWRRAALAANRGSGKLHSRNNLSNARTVIHSATPEGLKLDRPVQTSIARGTQELYQNA
jgi:AraC-like DNA-binding protein